MFLKIFKTTKIFFLITIAVLISFFIQTEPAKAVDFKALVCNGGGTTIQGVNITLSKESGENRGCVTGPSGTCNICTRVADGCSAPLPGGTYNVSVSKAGYTVNYTDSCITPTTYDTTLGIGPFLNVYLTPSTTTPPTGTTAPPGTYGLTTKPLKDIINGITEWLLGIAAGLAILYLVWGGIYYVTASGDEIQVEEAKRIIKYALMGLFVIGISYSVVVLIDKLIK